MQKSKLQNYKITKLQNYKITKLQIRVTSRFRRHSRLQTPASTKLQICRPTWTPHPESPAPQNYKLQNYKITKLQIRGPPPIWPTSKITKLQNYKITRFTEWAVSRGKSTFLSKFTLRRISSPLRGYPPYEPHRQLDPPMWGVSGT